MEYLVLLEAKKADIAMSRLEQQHCLLTESLDKTLRELDTFDNLAEEVLTRVVIPTINTYQEKVNVGVQDSVSDLLETFKQSITHVVIDAARGWRVANRDAFIFPRGCRFCFTKGDSTIFVIEQDPQVRSLAFQRGMLGDAYDVLRGTERVALSLPYVVFIFHFRTGVDASVYTGWRNTKLRSLEDKLAKSLLPNNHDNMSVCMGNNFTPPQDTTFGRTMGRDLMAEHIDSAISHYWQSQFNNDLATDWWCKYKLDNRLADGKSWANNSESNPMFILEVRLPYDGQKSLREMLNWLTTYENEPDENSLRHKLAESIDSCAEGLFSKILRYFKKTKFDKHHPKQIKDDLKVAMRGLFSELAELVLVIQHEMKSTSKDIETIKSKPVIEARGSLWTDYST
jgi:hypothetical protein